MERNFNRIYEEIHKEGNELLNRLRKKNNIKIAITIILIGVFWYLILIKHIVDIISLVMMFAMFVTVFVIAIKGQITYKAIFKASVIKRMVNMYSNKLEYIATGGVSRLEYNQSYFDTDYDKFYIEDCVAGIIGESTKLKMSQVITKKEETYVDSEGHTKTEYVTTFKGLYGIVKLEKAAFTNIDILRNANFIQSLFRKTRNIKNNRRFVKPPINLNVEKEKVEIDSAEFEKYYDFYATDKIMALRIVTAELIEKFVRVKEKDKRWLEVRIDNDMLYFRFGCGDIFEPIVLKNALDFNTLYRSFNILDIPISLVEAIVEHINAVE